MSIAAAVTYRPLVSPASYKSSDSSAKESYVDGWLVIKLKDGTVVYLKGVRLDAGPTRARAKRKVAKSAKARNTKPTNR